MLKMFRRSTDAKAQTAARTKVRFGVGPRLFLAFAAIVGMSTVSTVLTSKAFQQARQQLDQVAQQDVPHLIDGFGMVNISSAVVASLPSLRAAQSQEQLKQALAGVEEQLKKISSGESLADGDQSHVETIKKKIAEFAELKSRQLSDAETRQQIATEIHADRSDLLQKLTPIVDDLQFNMIIGSEDIAASDDVAGAIDNLINQEVAALTALAELKAEINLATGLLAQGAAAQEPAEIVPVKERFEAAASAVNKALSSIQVDQVDEIRVASEKLLGVGFGANSLFDLRGLELRRDEELTKLADVLAELLAEFSAQYDASAGAIAQGVSDRIVEIDQEFVTTEQTQMLIAGLAGLLSAAIVLLYVWRGLSRRIVSLSADMQAINMGNFDVEPNVKGKDEIALMAASVRELRDTAAQAQRMRDDLADRFDQSMQKVIADVKGSSDLVSRSTQELSVINQEVGQRTGSVNQISEANLANLQSVGAAAHQLSQSIAEIDQRLKHGAETTERSVIAATRTSETMEKLVQASRDIDDVRQVISDIAEQTNLLALNATIEAARAGDQGRGFAVVAQEVKTLALQTANATGNIAKRIQDVQLVTKDATEAIGVVVSSIQDVEQSSRSIANSISEQSIATESIARSVNELENNGRGITENAEQVSTSANKASQAIEQLSKLSNGLMQNSSTLAATANEFVNGLRAQH